MTDFELFEQALAEYETTKNNDIDILSEDSDVFCDHCDLVTENGIVSCLECGEQIHRTIMHEKEWRFYGHSDSKRSSDPNRVQMRKSEDRSINKDVENMGFSETIVAIANDIYTQVTKGQIYRGDSRKAVVFACIYHSYKMAGKCQTPKNLMETFGLSEPNIYGKGQTVSFVVPIKQNTSVRPSTRLMLMHLFTRMILKIG